MKSIASVPSVFLSLALAAGVALAAGDVKYQVERAKVYHGNPDAFSKPAVVTSLTVFQNIKAYKTIEEEKVTPESARYFLLMKEANEVFRKALTQVAKDEKADLVGEVGAIKADDPKVAVPDVTQKMVKAVEGK
ncbi:MAG TPA: hypothetical protein VFI25_16595 [Planctomycetota bacterium]|jgi:hypothetical protein|nr:hypothetical protein [Planctomycetota bacterium]